MNAAELKEIFIKSLVKEADKNAAEKIRKELEKSYKKIEKLRRE